MEHRHQHDPTSDGAVRQSSRTWYRFRLSQVEGEIDPLPHHRPRRAPCTGSRVSRPPKCFSDQTGQAPHDVVPPAARRAANTQRGAMVMVKRQSACYTG